MQSTNSSPFTFVKLSNDVVFRKVRDEIILIHLISGKIYYFTLSALPLFETLKSIQPIEELNMRELLPSEKYSGPELITFLMNEKILEKVELNEASQEQPLNEHFSSVHFLRLDEKLLDEVAFLCP